MRLVKVKSSVRQDGPASVSRRRSALHSHVQPSSHGYPSSYSLGRKRGNEQSKLKAKQPLEVNAAGVMVAHVRRDLGSIKNSSFPHSLPSFLFIIFSPGKSTALPIGTFTIQPVPPSLIDMPLHPLSWSVTHYS